MDTSFSLLLDEAGRRMDMPNGYGGVLIGHAYGDVGGFFKSR